MRRKKVLKKAKKVGSGSEKQKDQSIKITIKLKN